jgi:hypothetical protein
MKLFFAAIIGEIVKRIANWIENIARRRNHAKREKKRNAARRDPAGAFADHFGGRVRNVPGDASKTGKADP